MRAAFSVSQLMRVVPACPRNAQTARIARVARPFGTLATTTINEHFLPSIAPEVVGLILAIVLASQDDEPSDPLSEDVPYNVRSSEHGQGAFASRPIQRGEIILTDAPLVVWPNETSGDRARTLVDELTPRAREAFQSLADARPAGSTLEPALGIRGTNGFNIALPPIDPAVASTSKLQADLESTPSVSMIFPHISRINHSCLPNSDHAFDWRGLRMSVYATRDLQEGEEILIEYTAGLIQKTRDERRAIIREAFGFDCRCQACALPDAEAKASDDRRRQINTLVSRIAEDGQAGPSRRPAVVQSLEQLRTLLREENFVALPEFSSPAVSSSFAVYSRARQTMSPKDLLARSN